MALNEIFARDLVENREAIDGSTTVKSLVEWFRNRTECDYITVFQNGEIVGIAGRDHLNSKLAGQYGFSMLADKPVTKVIIDNPLTVSGDFDLQKLTQHLVSSGRVGNDFYHDIIVHEHERFLGLVSVKRLIISQTERILKQMEALNKQADVLASKNRELFETTVRLDQFNSKFKAFFETCSIPIIILDSKGKYLQGNPRFLKLSGYEHQELSDKLGSDYFFADGIDGVRMEYERTHKDYGDRRPTYNLRLKQKGGGEIGVEISFDIDEATSQMIVSIVRVATQEELEFQRILEERLKGRGALARSVAANLVDREGDVDSMMKKLNEVLHYAEQLEKGTELSGIKHLQNVGDSAMTGDISSFSPVDLAQLLIQGRKTGELRLTGRSGVGGRAFFSMGRIVHAESGLDEGLPAFRRLMKIKNGSFHFAYNVATPRLTIEGEPMWVLLNTCAEIDEEELAAVV